MTKTGWLRYTPYALIGAMVFAFMHMADEMAGNWDAGAKGGPMFDPTIASISTGVILLVPLIGLVLILQNRHWGYLIGLLFGLWAVLTGGSHFVNTADMTTFRWIVVVLEVAFAATLLALSASAMWTTKPWQKERSTKA